MTLFSDREVAPVITGEDTALSAQIDTIAAQVDRAPVDATINIDGTTPSVVDAADGRTLDRDGSAEAITDALAAGGDPSTPIELPVDVAKVRVDRAEAQRVLDETVTPALSAPVGIEGSDGTSAEVSVEAIAASLTFTPQDDGELAVAIDPTALQTALGDELKVFGSGAEDARFEVSGGAVTVVPSVDGVGIAPDHLAEQLMTVLTQSAPRTLNAELDRPGGLHHRGGAGPRRQGGDRQLHDQHRQREQRREHPRGRGAEAGARAGDSAAVMGHPGAHGPVEHVLQGDRRRHPAAGARR